VVARDGSTRTLDPGGLALTADKELKLTVNNPIDTDLWLKIEAVDTFGSDVEVFDFDGLYVWDAGDYKYLWMPADTETTVPLKLRDESDGGDFKITALYSRAIWVDPYQYGPPFLEQEAVMLEEFKFRVGCVRLERIKFFEFVAPPYYKEVKINIDANREIEDPEWINNDREKKPSKDPYNNKITAPLAIPRGRTLQMFTVFSCFGVDSWNVYAECIDDGSTAPNVCPYGDIMEETVTCERYGRNNFLKNIFSMSTYPTDVMTSMNHYLWKTYNHEYDSVTLSGNTILIEDTYHRVYTIYNDPINYSAFGLGYPGYNNPWIIPLELSMAIIDTCTITKPVPIDEEYFNKCITMGTYNSSWREREVNSIYFNSDGGTLVYNSGALGYEDDFYPGIGPYVFIRPYRLSLFLNNLIGNSSLEADCYAYNLFANILLKSIGVNIFPILLEDTREAPGNGGQVWLAAIDIKFSPGNIITPREGFENDVVNVSNSIPMPPDYINIYDSKLKFNWGGQYVYATGTVGSIYFSTVFPENNIRYWWMKVLSVE
jgi:hypothetical protein